MNDKNPRRSSTKIVVGSVALLIIVLASVTIWIVFYRNPEGTLTPTPTLTATITPTPSPNALPTSTPTPTPTSTPKPTSTPTATPTSSPTPAPTPSPVILSYNSSEWTSGYYRCFGLDAQVENNGGPGNVRVYADVNWGGSSIQNQTQYLLQYETKKFHFEWSMYLYGNVTAPILTRIWAEAA